MGKWLAIGVFVLAAAWSSEARAQATNYSDIWWNPNESGWGLTIADHESQLFAVWYTYRQDGSPTWYVIPGGTFTQNRRLFSGTVYETRGPAWSNDVFNASAVTVTAVGTMQIDFAPPGLGSGIALMSYTIGSVTGSKQIQRQPFGNALPDWGGDVTDIWWNPLESGWGLTLAQHGNQIFGVWFTYEEDGRPLWVVMPGVTFDGATSFRGALYTARGPYFGGPFNASAVQITEAGDATISLDEGVSAAKVLSRGRLNTRFRQKVQVRDLTPQGFGAARPTTPRGSITFENPGPLTVRRGEPVTHCYCRPDPGSSMCGILQGHTSPRGGTPPYRFTTSNSFPPLGLTLSPFRGCLTGTVSSSLATTSGQFTVCARDLGGREACTNTTWTLEETQPADVGPCTGTGIINVSGTLTPPNGGCPQPFSRSGHSMSMVITMDWSNVPGPGPAQVTMGAGGLWICRNLQPSADTQIQVPSVTLTRTGTGFSGTGFGTDANGRFDISFTGNASGASGTFSRTYQNSAVGANWSYQGTFSCTR